MEYLGIPFSVKNTPCLQPDFLPFAPWRIREIGLLGLCRS